MQLLREVCSLPTAPFAEHHVVRYLERFVRERPGLRLSRDKTGNLLIQLPTKSRGPRLVFTAHMDHPGLVAGRTSAAGTLHAQFRGGVLLEYVKGQKVRFFDAGGGEVRGTIVEVKPDGARGAYPGRCVVDVRGRVAPGSPGMFDQGEGRVRGKRFLSRAVDDLGGLAGALAMLDELHRKPPAAPVALLATRAEEDGFIGAVAASKELGLLRRSDCLIAIECSAMQPYAPQGAGAIIRVGDRTSVFHSALTYFITQQAEALKKADKSFRYQRALMPGGTCEATVYDLYGFVAASICVPLGNYHNMDRAKKRVGPEYIDTGDWQNMVKLFVRVARAAHAFDPANPQLRARIEKRFNKLRHLL